MSYKTGMQRPRRWHRLIAGPIYPCNPATARGESTKLGADPKGEKIVYTNGRAVIVSSTASPCPRDSRGTSGSGS